MSEELQAAWLELWELNDERRTRLARQGIVLDLDGTIRQTWLEHILRAVAGEEGIWRCKLATQGRIAELLDQAERQVDRAKLLAP